MPGPQAPLSPLPPSPRPAVLLWRAAALVPVHMAPFCSRPNSRVTQAGSEGAGALCPEVPDPSPCRPCPPSVTLPLAAPASVQCCWPWAGAPGPLSYPPGAAGAAQPLLGSPLPPGGGCGYGGEAAVAACPRVRAFRTESHPGSPQGCVLGLRGRLQQGFLLALSSRQPIRVPGLPPPSVWSSSWWS